MKGKHQHGVVLTGAPKGAKKKSTFANMVVSVCVVVALLVTLSAVWEYHRLNTAMPSGVLTAIFGMWGGELLIVALRQILGSDALRRDQSTDVSTTVQTTVQSSVRTGETNDSDIFGGSV